MPSTNFHAIINLWIISKVFGANIKSTAVFYTIIWGSMFPDFSMLIFILYFAFSGADFETIFGDLYYTSLNWIALKNYFHSIPLSLFGFIVFYAIDKFLISRKNKKQQQETTDDNINNTTDDVEIARMNKILSTSIASTPDDVETDDIKHDNNMDDIKDDDNDIERDIVDMDNDEDIINATCIGGGAPCWFNKNYWWILCSYWCLSMCIHSIFDFLLHNDDAHSNWVPLTQWKFYSPISYWDPNHYGYIWPFFELGFSLYWAYWICSIKKNQWKQSCRQWIWKLWIIIIAGNIIFFALLVFGTIFTLFQSANIQ